MLIPNNIVEQFRTVAVERLERIETAWEQVLRHLDDRAAAVAHRELHTLKGEARIVGFADVNLVCHKLEDLFDVASGRGYAIDEDFDLAVNMALRFIAMLVRKRAGSNLGGFDLPGFVSHIDKLLAESRSESTGRTRISNPSSSPASATASSRRVSRAHREQIAPAAIDAFIEFAMARGARRHRLRSSWYLLRDLVGIQRAVLGPDQLTKHRAHAETLARELGKSAAVRFELPAIEVTSEVLAAVDAVVLHLVRNAIDHGIETPDARTAAGKPAVGTIRIGARLDDSELELTVSDDGRGIDFAKVRASALARGLVDAPTADRLEPARWIDIMCSPGFTTRDAASEISGRGVGLDAVRAAANELGGEVTANSRDGVGMTWHVTFTVPQTVEEVHVLRIANLPFPVAIDAGWHPVRAAVDAVTLDIGQALGIAEATSGSAIAFTRDHAPAISIMCEQLRGTMKAHRIVPSPATASGEVVSLDMVEALLVRPERLVNVALLEGIHAHA